MLTSLALGYVILTDDNGTQTTPLSTSAGSKAKPDVRHVPLSESAEYPAPMIQLQQLVSAQLELTQPKANHSTAGAPNPTLAELNKLKQRLDALNQN